MTGAVVIGVGNPWRRDDGVGHAVARQVVDRHRDARDLRVELLDGEPARLLDAWDGADLVVVVDALRGDDAGAVVVVDPDDPDGAPSSSHGLGLTDAVALGRRLGRLPGSLVVLGVVGVDFGDGPGLTPSVATAVGPATERVLRLLDERAAPTVPGHAAVDPGPVAPGGGGPPGPPGRG